MELEKVTAEIRPRSQWEAIDLGVRMVSKHAISLIKGWMSSVYPLALLILFICHQAIWWGVFLIWWLKPVWERVALHPLSRSLFGEHPTWRATALVLPAELRKNKGLVLMGVILTALGWWIHRDPGEGADPDPRTALATLYWLVVIGLLFYRSGPNRSLVLPIQYLEGLQGSRFKSRLQTLAYRSSGGAIGLMSICLLMEFLLLGSQLWFVLNMTPQGMGLNDSLILDGFYEWELELVPNWVWCLFAFFYLNAMSIVSWFYTGAGFGLYVNTRTWTEGWDIELKFKGLGRRLGLLAIGMILLSGSETRANEEARRILDGEDFKVETRGIYELRESETDEEKEKRKDGEDRDRENGNGSFGEGRHGGAFSGVGAGLFWIILGLAVMAIVWVVIINLHLFRSDQEPRDRGKRKKVKTVAGMNVEPEKLPERLVQTARRLWDEGRKKEALGLLYRGAISRLVVGQIVGIQESDTEMDCLRRVKRAGEAAHASYFEVLTEAWISEAYARRSPDDETVDLLWGKWPFEEGRGS
jgi:hypothetical protein